MGITLEGWPQGAERPFSINTTCIDILNEKLAKLSNYVSKRRDLRNLEIPERKNIRCSLQSKNIEMTMENEYSTAIWWLAFSVVYIDYKYEVLPVQYENQLVTPTPIREMILKTFTKLMGIAPSIPMGRFARGGEKASCTWSICCRHCKLWIKDINTDPSPVQPVGVREYARLQQYVTRYSTRRKRKKYFLQWNPHSTERDDWELGDIQPTLRLHIGSIN